MARPYRLTIVLFREDQRKLEAIRKKVEKASSLIAEELNEQADTTHKYSRRITRGRVIRALIRKYFKEVSS